MTALVMHYVFLFNHESRDYEAIGAFSSKVAADALLAQAKADFEGAGRVFSGAVVAKTWAEFLAMVHGHKFVQIEERLDSIAKAVGGAALAAEPPDASLEGSGGACTATTLTSSDGKFPAAVEPTT